MCDFTGIPSNFAEGIELFNKAIIRMLEPNAFWKISGQPNWLVDVFILSGRMDFYPSIIEELNLMRISSTITRPIGSSLPAYYSYSVMELIRPSSANISEWIKVLLKWPKIKEYYYIGQCLQAIFTVNQTSFNQSFTGLLKVHEGKTKYGELRSTPEGWLSMPAMSLAFLAIEKNIEMEMKNEYFSREYLAFLRERRKA